MSFWAFANDPDYPDFVASGTDRQTGKITYTVSNLPPGATFDQNTAQFSWTPTNTDTGTYKITFTATDDGNGTGEPKTTTVVVPIQVIAVNRLPVATTIANRVLRRGETLALPANFTDADGNALTYSGNPLPLLCRVFPLENRAKIANNQADSD